MRRPFAIILSGLAIAAGAALAPARAHDAPVILQLGGASEKVSHSGKSQCLREGGVLLCTGPNAPMPAKKAPASRLVQDRTIIIIDRRAPRRLRTQGFYSGKVYQSRRFTQGFFADALDQD